MSDPIYVTASQVRSLKPCGSQVNDVLEWISSAYGREIAPDEPLKLSLALDAGRPYHDVCWVLRCVDPDRLAKWVQSCVAVAINDVEHLLSKLSPCDELTTLLSAFESAKEIFDTTRRCRYSALTTPCDVTMGLYCKSFESSNRIARNVADYYVASAAEAVNALLYAVVYASDACMPMSTYSWACQVWFWLPPDLRTQRLNESIVSLRQFLDGDRDV